MMTATIISATLAFLSGAAWGLHEATAHHWGKFKERFPRASPQWWNPQISWRNKYVWGNPDQKRNNIPIWLTDAAHMLASTNQILIFSAGIFLARSSPMIGLPICMAAYTIGNYLTFNWVYKK